MPWLAQTPAGWPHCSPPSHPRAGSEGATWVTRPLPPPCPAPQLPEVLKKLAGWGRGHASGAGGYCTHFLVVTAAAPLQQEATPKFSGLRAQEVLTGLDLETGQRGTQRALPGPGPRQRPGWDPEGGHAPSPTTLVPVSSVSLSQVTRSLDSKFRRTLTETSAQPASREMCAAGEGEGGVHSAGVPWVA